MNPRPSEYMTYFRALNLPKAALVHHHVRPEIEGGDARSIVISNYIVQERFIKLN